MQFFVNGTMIIDITCITCMKDAGLEYETYINNYVLGFYDAHSQEQLLTTLIDWTLDNDPRRDFVVDWNDAEFHGYITQENDARFFYHYPVRFDALNFRV